MSNVILPNLSRDRVVQAEITNHLNALAAALNVSRIQENDVEPDAVRLRHISQSPKFNLGRRYGTASGSTINATPWSDGTKNWYTIPESELRFSLGATGLPNLYESNKPVIQVYGPFHTNHSGVSTGDNSTANPITEVCLGMSTDGGTNWTPLSAITARPVGPTCGGSFAFFKGPQKHYLFGTSNYHPRYPWDRACWLEGSFGGDTKTSDSSGNRWFRVMVDATSTQDGQFYGELFGDMRRIT